MGAGTRQAPSTRPPFLATPAQRGQTGDGRHALRHKSGAGWREDPLCAWSCQASRSYGWGPLHLPAKCGHLWAQHGSSSAACFTGAGNAVTTQPVSGWEHKGGRTGPPELEAGQAASACKTCPQGSGSRFPGRNEHEATAGAGSSWLFPAWLCTEGHGQGRGGCGGQAMHLSLAISHLEPCSLLPAST